ncbi:hypothetical protein ACFQFR_19410 [Streptomyces goshikiensis]
MPFVRTAAQAAVILIVCLIVCFTTALLTMREAMLAAGQLGLGRVGGNGHAGVEVELVHRYCTFHLTQGAAPRVGTPEGVPVAARK